MYKINPSMQSINKTLPDNLRQKLKQKYNPEGSELREYQKYLLRVLIDFDKTCKKLGVKYWLSSGTVLGAIRHGGFIPWDDDIDVEMPWEDYQIFLKNFKVTSNYAIQTLDNDRAYMYSFAKFRDLNSEIIESQISYSKDFIYKGAYIDIFYTEYRYKIISGLFYSWFVFAIKLNHWIKNQRLKNFAIKCCKKIGWNCALLLRHLLKPFPGKKYGYGFGCGFYRQDLNYKDIFPLRDIVFEGHTFPGPGNPDGYLTSIYGDYMQIPNIENIKTHAIKFVNKGDSVI